MTELSSADFCKLSVQDVADMLLDQEKNVVLSVSMKLWVLRGYQYECS